MKIALDDDRSTIVFQILFCLIALGLLLWIQSDALAFAMFGPPDVVKLMTPLVLTAAFIERAVEVIISPWRDTGADKLTTNLKIARAVPAPGTEPVVVKLDMVQDASHELAEYRGRTQRFAYLTAFALGLIASLAGVRTIRPFLKPDALTHLNPAQHALFVGFDVLLTGALLAGGADGLHSIISAVTTFFNTTADNAAISNRS